MPIFEKRIDFSTAGKTSLNLFIVNLFIIFFALLLDMNVHGGGTGDIEEGDNLIDLYFISLCFVSFICITIFILSGYVKNQKYSFVISVANLIGVMVIAALVFYKIKFLGNTLYPYDVTGFRAINMNLLILKISTIMFILFGILFGLIGFKRDRQCSFIGIGLNTLLLILYIVLIMVGIVGEKLT